MKLRQIKRCEHLVNQENIITEENEVELKQNEILEIQTEMKTEM